MNGFGAIAFTPDEVQHVKKELARNLGPEYISNRVGPGGSRVSYIEGQTAINLANDVFGFNGWSSSVVSITTDFLDEVDGKVSCGISCLVRVTLKDGTFHEDLGYGVADNMRRKAEAFEKAKKEAVTDALKRALRNFGNVLGNCLYNKSFLQTVAKIKSPAVIYEEKELRRHPSIKRPSPVIEETVSKVQRIERPAPVLRLPSDDLFNDFGLCDDHIGVDLPEQLPSNGKEVSPPPSKNPGMAQTPPRKSLGMKPTPSFTAASRLQ
jgi:DNA recombination protein Rad52